MLFSIISWIHHYLGNSGILSTLGTLGGAESCFMAGVISGMFGIVWVCYWLFCFAFVLRIYMYARLLSAVTVTFLSLAIGWLSYFVLLFQRCLWLRQVIPCLVLFLVWFRCGEIIWLFSWSAILLFLGCIHSDTCSVLVLWLGIIRWIYGGPISFCCCVVHVPTPFSQVGRMGSCYNWRFSWGFTLMIDVD